MPDLTENVRLNRFIFQIDVLGFIDAIVGVAQTVFIKLKKVFGHTNNFFRVVGSRSYSEQNHFENLAQHQQQRVKTFA
jgi:hypothetical protein